MPFVTVGDLRLFYRLEGMAGRPVLVLSHSIGADHAMWNSQMASLLPHFQVLRYDIRGHGASDAPPGDYSIAQLGGDVLGLADALGIGSFAFCGLSLGGGIGQWVAANAPQRVSQLVLANTSPRFGSPANWQTRIAAVQAGGMASIIDLAMQRFFSPLTIASQSNESSLVAASIRAVVLGTNPQGYMGCCAALRDAELAPLLGQIKAPTLIVVGTRDVSTPWEGHGEVLAREIAGARVVRLEAAHISNVERPSSFSAALVDFLAPTAAASDDPLTAGFAVRRAVLGDAHVDKSMAAATDLNREFQAMITRYAWGTIWTRPGLSHRTRRLLVLATTAALGRWEEFSLHLRTGLEHELELCDVKEVLLQTAVYAGVPAANTAFHLAGEIVAERGRAQTSGTQASEKPPQS